MKLDLKKILKELEAYKGRKAIPEPKQAALLVIDLQNYFSRIVKPVLGNILRVIQLCRQRGIPILFTQHGHIHPESDGGELIGWWGEVIIEGDRRLETGFQKLRSSQGMWFSPKNIIVPFWRRTSIRGFNPRGLKI